MAERRRPRSRKTSALKNKTPAKKAGAKKKAKKTADPHAAVRRYRERMRAKGYRPVTIWVPDLNNPEVARKMQDELAAIRHHELTSPQARDDAAFWEKVAAESWIDLPDYDWGPDGPPKG